MKKMMLILICLLLTVTANPTLAKRLPGEISDQAAVVEVDVSNAYYFTDIDFDGTDSEKGHQVVLNHIKEVFAEAAQEVLFNGYHLTIKVIDVDLAGAYEPGGLPGSPRIGRNIFSPRIEFDYQLVNSSGSVVEAGSEDLKEMDSPVQRWGAIIQDNEIAGGVSELIREWFRNHKWPDKARIGIGHLEPKGELKAPTEINWET